MKMIVTDLDGTFLNRKSQIPESNLKALEIIKEKGIEFVIASGRSFYSLDYFLSNLSLKGADNCGIGFNGCVVYKTEDFKILNQILLKNELMHEIIEQIQIFDLEFFAYDSSGKLLTGNSQSTNFKAYHSLTHNPFIEVDSFNNYKEDIYKIFIRNSRKKLEEIYKYMDSWVTGKCNMFYSADNLLEFTPAQATKGNALKSLAEYKGIDLSDIIAIGDNNNDISMIKCAGIGVGVNNAVPDIKEAADYITEADCDDGSLMEVVHKFIL